MSHAFDILAAAMQPAMCLWYGLNWQTLPNWWQIFGGVSVVIWTISNVRRAYLAERAGQPR